MPRSSDQIRADPAPINARELGEPTHFGLGRHWAKNNANRKWVYMERDPTAFGVNRSIDAPLVGDLRDIVPQLTEQLKDAPRSPSAELEALIRQHAAFKAEVLASAPTGMVPVHTARFIVEATKNLPKDTILLRDGGAVTIFGWHSGILAFDDAGKRLFEADKPPAFAVWARLREGEGDDPMAALLAVADALPCAAMVNFPKPAGLAFDMVVERTCRGWLFAAEYARLQ